MLLSSTSGQAFELKFTVKDGTSRCRGSSVQSSSTRELTLASFLQSPGLKVKQSTFHSSCLDLQMVNVKMRVLIKPDVARLPDIYRYLGMDYDGRVLPSLGNEVLKSVIARYTATQLLTERE